MLEINGQRQADIETLQRVGDTIVSFIMPATTTRYMTLKMLIEMLICRQGDSKKKQLNTYKCNPATSLSLPTLARTYLLTMLDIGLQCLELTCHDFPHHQGEHPQNVA